MAVGRLVIPQWMPARDRSKRLVSGALLTVYDNETTDKASIYSDVAMTVALSNPVVANSSGHFPAIYCEAGTTADPTLYSVAITGPDGESIVNPGTFDDYQPSIDYETAALALSEAAQSGAESAQTAAEAVLADILAIQATGDDAAAIATRAAKAANGSDFTDAAEVRTNIGIRPYRAVASAAALALGVAAGDANVLTAASTEVSSTQTVTASGSVEAGVEGAEIYKPTSGKIFEIEPLAVTGGTLASAVAEGSTTVTFVDAIPAGLVAGVFVDLGDVSHVRMVTAVNTGTKTITLNYATGRAMAKGETVNYRVPLDYYKLTKATLRKAGSSGANITIKYVKRVDLTAVTSLNTTSNAITLYHCGWSHMDGRIDLPNATTRDCQFGILLYNCENAHVVSQEGNNWGEYLLQMKDCRDCSGENIRGIKQSDDTNTCDIVANIKCSSLHPVWNVHLRNVKGISVTQYTVLMTHLRKEGTFFHPSNVSVNGVEAKSCNGVQFAADYGSKWLMPTASNIQSEGGIALAVLVNMPGGAFYNVQGAKCAGRHVLVDSDGHQFHGGRSENAYYGSSGGQDIRFGAAAYNAIGRIEFSDLPAAGSTITLNGKTITFVSSGAVAANHECNIGATVLATMENLAGTWGAGTGGLLNDSTDPLLTVASYTAWNAALQIVYDSTGSAGDAYTLAVGAGSNATIFKFKTGDADTLKGGTTTGGSNNRFYNWEFVVNDSSAGVTSAVSEASASCTGNYFLMCKITDSVGKYTTDYAFQAAGTSRAVSMDWDTGSAITTRSRRVPPLLDVQRLGNQTTTLTVGQSPRLTVFDTDPVTTNLTTNRACTLSTTNVYEGAEFVIVRRIGGAFHINVNAGLATLTQYQGCIVRYINGAWAVVHRFCVSPDSGWTTGTGTELKGAIATYGAGSAITAPSGGVTQDAEARTAIGALITRLATVETALQNESQRRLALEVAIRRAGLISGTTSTGTVG